MYPGSNTAQQIPLNREDIGHKSPSREEICGIKCDSLLCCPKNCSEISFLQQQLGLSRQGLTEKLKPTCVTNVSAPKLPCFPIKKIMRTPIVYSFFFFSAPSESLVNNIELKLLNYQEYGLRKLQISQYFYNVFNAFLIEKHIIGENGW